MKLLKGSDNKNKGMKMFTNMKSANCQHTVWR